MLTFGKDDFSYKMSILKSADENGSACNRYTFSYSALNGLGHFLHTYVCDGNPIPTFQGEPERVEIPDCIDEFTSLIWNNLNEKNKISLYVIVAVAIIYLISMILSLAGVSLKVVVALQNLATAIMICITAVLAWRYVSKKPTVWKVLYFVSLLVVIAGVIVPLIK